MDCPYCKNVVRFTGEASLKLFTAVEFLKIGNLTGNEYFYRVYADKIETCKKDKKSGKISIISCSLFNENEEPKKRFLKGDR